MLGRHHLTSATARAWGLGSTQTRRHCLTPLLFGLFASMLTFLLPAQRVLAEPDQVQAEVLIVLASGEDGSVDPSLSKVKALKHPPFNEYKTLKLLSRSIVELPKDQSVEIALPNGRTLVLRLVAQLPDGRAKVQLSISRPRRKEYLPLLEVLASAGEPFFVAGQKYEGGTLVLGIRAGEDLKPSAR